MANNPNIVINGKGYYLPFLEGKIEGYIEIHSSFGSHSINIRGTMFGVNLSQSGTTILINGIDIFKYIQEHHLPPLAVVHKLEADFDLPPKVSDDKFENMILQNGIQSGLKCPQCGKNTLKSVGGLVNKCSSCGYKKIGGKLVTA